ncbi:YihY family protein [Fictibacillus macauensis ZFHKF-1]|uniref:YihY family protein n=1 Tax=Fictibacillus macauensis ZFHKF-1 TaxID=1196324 RepID=I8UD15_9BACL|nr:YihY/virulence factor BrkB family protein [Fictibacillus macauensis]EIT84693.1 YihY family protein [Fictibacillus macauensis ZFHKF-1]
MRLYQELKHLSWKAFFLEMKESFIKSKITGLAAQLAYYFLLSLFPFLIFLLTLGGIFISPEDALSILNHVIPGQSSKLIQDNIYAVLETRNNGLLSFGIIAALWSASNGVNALIMALNEAYGVKECRSFVKTRLLAILLTVGVIIAIVVALILPVFGKAIGMFIFSYLGLDTYFLNMWALLRWAISFVIIAIVFSILYYTGPCKRLSYKDVCYGAVVSTLLWQLVSLCFAYYVDHFGKFTSTYGSLGAIIVLMLWFYLTGIVILIGGLINAILHKFKVDRVYAKGLLEEKVD